MKYKDPYCWWFRNPKEPPGMVKNPINNGIFSSSLEVSRILEPSTVGNPYESLELVAKAIHRDAPASRFLALDSNGDGRLSIKEISYLVFFGLHIGHGGSRVTTPEM